VGRGTAQIPPYVIVELMIAELIARVWKLMGMVNELQPKIFPLAVQEVSGYDYGVPTSYSPKHLGVDWVARFVQLRAPCNGEILKVSNGVQGGKTIWFRPAGETTTIRWLHLSEIHVKAKQLVGQGQLIGVTGDTGDSKGPHLHEDIWKRTVTLKFSDTINPHTYYM